MGLASRRNPHAVLVIRLYKPNIKNTFTIMQFVYGNPCINNTKSIIPLTNFFSEIPCHRLFTSQNYAQIRMKSSRHDSK